MSQPLNNVITPSKFNTPKPDLKLDSKVSLFIAEQLNGKYALCPHEDAIYEWDKTLGFWVVKGVTSKKLPKIAHTYLTKHYGDEGFQSPKVTNIGKMLSYDVTEMIQPPDDCIIFFNGTLNPITGEFTQLDVKQLFPRYSTGVDYYQTDGSKEQCPEFMRYMGFVTGVDDLECDMERATERFQTILAAMVMILLRRHQWQMFIEVVGDGGTGKSTLAALISLLVGEQSTKTIESKHLEVPERRGDIVNATLLYMPDMEGFQGEAAGLKKITGGDPVSCRRLYGPSFTAYIRAVILAVNNSPMRFTDRGGAIQRRRVLIRLNRVVPVDSRDHGLKSKLRDEVPAIIQYLLRWVTQVGGEKGVRKILSNAINSKDAQEVLSDIDPMVGFANTLHYDPKYKTQIGGNPAHAKVESPKIMLFHAYMKYCNYFKYETRISQKTFSDAFLQVGKRFGPVSKNKLGGKSYMVGVSITAPSQPIQEWLEI